MLDRDFLNPILLVTLFLPGEKVSAAAALGALYYFALANQVCSLNEQQVTASLKVLPTFLLVSKVDSVQ